MWNFKLRFQHLFLEYSVIQELHVLFYHFASYLSVFSIYFMIKNIGQKVYIPVYHNDIYQIDIMS
jgi:hypothetical protein